MKSSLSYRTHWHPPPARTEPRLSTAGAAALRAMTEPKPAVPRAAMASPCSARPAVPKAARASGGSVSFASAARAARLASTPSPRQSSAASAVSAVSAYSAASAASAATAASAASAATAASNATAASAPDAATPVGHTSLELLQVAAQVERERDAALAANDMLEQLRVAHLERIVTLEDLYKDLLAEQRTEADAAGGRDRFLRAQLRRAEVEGAVLARGCADAHVELPRTLTLTLTLTLTPTLTLTLTLALTPTLSLTLTPTG